MLRFALILILILFIARAFWRVVDGLGLRGNASTPVTASGVD